MGGFTTIQLEDTTQLNIDTQNARLEICGVPKRYRFYSERDVIFEYEYFKAGKGEFREELFPKDKINSLEDFKRYWSPQALGEIFVPHCGMLTFDCYFGRTSKTAMKALGRYISDIDNIKEIKSVGGSFSTFIERAGLSKLSLEIVKDYFPHDV